MSRGSALGAQIHYKNPGYLLMAGVQDFDFPVGECADLETTSHASTQKEFEPGIVDGQQIDIPLVWDDAHVSHVWVLANLHTKKEFKYTAKDGSEFEFFANLESLTVQNPRGTGAKIRVLTIVPTLA